MGSTEDVTGSEKVPVYAIGITNSHQLCSVGSGGLTKSLHQGDETALKEELDG